MKNPHVYTYQVVIPIIKLNIAVVCHNIYLHQKKMSVDRMYI